MRPNGLMEMQLNSRDKLAEDITPADRKSLLLLRDYSSSGDKEALSEFIRIHQKLVYGFAYRWMRSGADAEDAVQSVFLDVMRRSGEYGNVRSVKNWLVGITRKACFNKIRSDNRRSRREQVVGERLGNVVQMDSQEKIAENETQKLLLDMIRTLPEKYRTPLLMKYSGGLTNREMAGIMGSNESTVRTHLARGLDKLRANLQEAGVSLSAAALMQALDTMPELNVPLALQNQLQQTAHLGETAGEPELSTAADSSSSSSVLWAAAVIGITTTVYFAVNPNQNSTNTKVPIPQTKPADTVLEKYSKTWTFENGLPANNEIQLLEGHWEWIPKGKRLDAGIAFEVGNPSVIRISGAPTNGPLKITADVFYYASYYNKKGSILPHYLRYPKTVPTTLRLFHSRKLPDVPTEFSAYMYKNNIVVCRSAQPFAIFDVEDRKESDELMLTLASVVVNRLQVEQIDEKDIPQTVLDEVKSANITADSEIKKPVSQWEVGKIYARSKTTNNSRTFKFPEFEFANGFIPKGSKCRWENSGILFPASNTQSSSIVIPMLFVGIKPLAVKIKAGPILTGIENDTFSLRSYWGEMSSNGGFDLFQYGATKIEPEEMNSGFTFYYIGNYIFSYMGDRLVNFIVSDYPHPSPYIHLNGVNIFLEEISVAEINHEELPKELKHPEQFSRKTAREWEDLSPALWRFQSGKWEVKKFSDHSLLND